MRRQQPTEWGRTFVSSSSGIRLISQLCKEIKQTAQSPMGMQTGAVEVVLLVRAAMQAYGPELSPQHPCRKAGHADSCL